MVEKIASEIIDKYKNEYGYVENIEKISAVLKANQELTIEDRSSILLLLLEYNIKQDEINKAKLKTTAKRVSKEKELKEEIKKKEEQEIVEDNLTDVAPYIEALKKCDDDDFLTEILPSIYDNNYESIIISIILQFYQEIALAEQMMCEEQDKESIDYLKELIKKDKKIISIIKEYNKEEEQVEEKEESTTSNTLIFLPKESNSLYIDSDIDEIATEDDVLPILNDIKTNNITREKRFHNHQELKGISAIRRRDSRIIFARLDNNIIVILGILVKRFQNPLIYSEMLEVRAKRFRSIREDLKELMNNQEFIDLNNDKYSEVLERLNSRNKTLSRGDNNGTSN